MPVHRHKKDTIPTLPASTQEQIVPPLPDPQTFQQYLRVLAREAIRVVLEGDDARGVRCLHWSCVGSMQPQRKGYRNGTYTRDLAISTGRLEEIKVPRDRAGQFHT